MTGARERLEVSEAACLLLELICGLKDPGEMCNCSALSSPSPPFSSACDAGDASFRSLFTQRKAASARVGLMSVSGCVCEAKSWLLADPWTEVNRGRERIGEEDAEIHSEAGRENEERRIF